MGIDMKIDNYVCDGQINMTDYLKSQMCNGTVMDLTSWINSQGKAQYTQIGEIIRQSYEKNKDSADLIDILTNTVSIYVLDQSMGYMEYLKEQAKL